MSHSHLDYFSKCTEVSIGNIQLLLPPYTTTHARNINPIQTLKDVSVSQLTILTKMQIISTAENISGFIELGKPFRWILAGTFWSILWVHNLYPLNACGGFAIRINNWLLVVVLLLQLVCNLFPWNEPLVLGRTLENYTLQYVSEATVVTRMMTAIMTIARVFTLTEKLFLFISKYSPAGVA